MVSSLQLLIGFLFVLASSSSYAADELQFVSRRSSQLRDRDRCVRELAPRENDSYGYVNAQTNVQKDILFGQIAPPGTHSGIIKAIRSHGNVPDAEQMHAILIKAIEKRFRPLFRDNRLSEEKYYELEEDFIQHYTELFAGDSEKAHGFLNLLHIPKPLVGPDGMFFSYDELIDELKLIEPEAMVILEREVSKQAFIFFSMRLHPPTVEQTAKIMSFSDVEFLRALTSTMDFWEMAQNSDYATYLTDARTRIINAYVRSVRQTDTPTQMKSRKIAPGARQLVEALGRTQGNRWYLQRQLSGDYGRWNMQDRSHVMKAMNLFVEEMEHMLGIQQAPHDPEWIFDMPTLFPGGFDELKRLAMAQSPAVFNDFVDTNFMNPESSERLIEEIEETKGMMISAYTPGREINWALVDAMQMKAEAEDKIIILISETGNIEGTHPELLNRERFSRIRILPTTIENKYLKIWNHPNKGRKRAFDSKVKDPAAWSHGGTIIVPHHTFEHEALPSDINSHDTTKLYSTGTINVSTTGGMSGHQKAKAQEIDEQIKQGFLVVEKANMVADEDGDNPYKVHNRWHTRPVEWRGENDHYAAGFSDQGLKYAVNYSDDGSYSISAKESRPRFLYLFDLHFLNSDPSVMMGLSQYMRLILRPDDIFSVIGPDYMDLASINHHAQKNPRTRNRESLRKMIESGYISFEKEHYNATTNINSLQAYFQRMTFIAQYANHTDEWTLMDLINDPSDLHQIINDPLISEMIFARSLHSDETWGYLEYLLKHREGFLTGAAGGIQERLQGKIFIQDPSRVVVMKHGDPLPDNPDQQYSSRGDHHGHQGFSGTKGNMRAHIRGAGNGRTDIADGHIPLYYGAGDGFATRVGVAMKEADYTTGGYTGWGLAIVPKFLDGTKTHIYMDEATNSFQQNLDEPVILGKAYFGSDPLLPSEGPNNTLNDQRRREHDSEAYMQLLQDKSVVMKPGFIRP